MVAWRGRFRRGRGSVRRLHDLGLQAPPLLFRRAEVARTCADLGDERLRRRIQQHFDGRTVQQRPDGWFFGMWLSSGQLPEQWALERLESFMEATATPEPDHAIAEQLAKIASVDIAKVARILDRMVRGDREGWRIQGWLNSARQILEAAMKAGGEARSQAELTIDYLGRRGHTSFGDLLGLGGTAV